MRKAVLILSWLLLAIACQADIIIVDDNGAADFDNIQAAIDDSNDGDIVVVFPGRYTGDGNRDIDFGGRAITVQSVAPDDPYIVGATIIDCEGTEADPHRGFYFHSWEAGDSVLAGLTITNGYAEYGGGIYCNDSGPTITNCTVTGNTAEYGGGIESWYGLITNCIISGNSAIGGGGLAGCHQVTNCIISGNSAIEGGGLLGCDEVTNCVISGNSANQNGGGILNCFAPANCVISGNSAGQNGGGICCEYQSMITSCTLSGNAATGGFGGGIYAYRYGGFTATNSIVWGNTDSSGTIETAQIGGGEPYLVTFSCIQDEDPDDANIPFGGEDNNNIDDNPMFSRDPNHGGDGWGVGNNDDFGDLHLQSGSPCINSGDPLIYIGPDSVDIDGQPRVMGGIVDMGADEFLISTIVVTKPKGWEVWASGSRHEIKWLSYGVAGTVDILLSEDGGSSWQTVEGSIADTGSYTWHLPDVDSNQCVISVVPSVPDPNVVITNSGLFTIHPDSPGPAVVPKWKSLGGDFDRTGLSDSSGPELGCVKWQFETSGAVSASVTVGPNDTVYVPCEDGNLYKLDANGVLLWSYDTNSPLISAASIGPDGTAYVGAKNGKLYAIDIDGKLRWTHTTGGLIYSSPAVSEEGNVYVGSEDGILYALGRDGSELWSFETNSFGALGGAIFASPTIGADGTIYIAGLYDPNLYALEPNDGSVKWVCQFESGGWPFASPVIRDDGTIYQALLYDPNLYAIDSNNGTIIWSTNLADTNSGLFETYYCYFLDRDRRECVRTECNDVSSSGWSEPALGPDGTIYVSFDDPYLRAVAPNGSIKWVSRLGLMGGFTLTIGSDGLIYAASDDGFLCVVDVNGNEVARFKSNSWLSLPVISADNTIVVADSIDNTTLINYENNKVWAIRVE